jgi:formylglycine-generating enzyme required for sulfatase activity
MGSTEQRYPADAEGPPRTVRVAPFRIAAHAVSNDDFAAFCADRFGSSRPR